MVNFLWKALPRKVADLNARNGQKSRKIGLIFMDSPLVAAQRRSAPADTITTIKETQKFEKIRKKPIKLNLNSYFQLHTFGGRRGRGRKKIKKI